MYIESHIIGYYIISFIDNLLVLNSPKLFNSYYIVNFYAFCLRENL